MTPMIPKQHKLANKKQTEIPFKKTIANPSEFRRVLEEVSDKQPLPKPSPFRAAALGILKHTKRILINIPSFHVFQDKLVLVYIEGHTLVPRRSNLNHMGHNTDPSSYKQLPLESHEPHHNDTFQEPTYQMRRVDTPSYVGRDQARSARISSQLRRRLSGPFSQGPVQTRN